MKIILLFKGVASAVKNSMYFTRAAVSGILDTMDAKAFVNEAAHRLIWGYDDNLYSMTRGYLALSTNAPLLVEKFGLMAQVSKKKDFSMNPVADTFLLIPEKWNFEGCNHH